MKNIWALLAMMVGVLALLSGVVFATLNPLYGIIGGVIPLILGIMGYVKLSKDPYAGGKVLSAIGLVAGIYLIVMGSMSLAKGSDPSWRSTCGGYGSLGMLGDRGGDLHCFDYEIESNEVVKLKLEYEYSYEVQDLTISLEGTCEPQRVTLKQDEEMEFTCPISNTERGERYSGELTGTYKIVYSNGNSEARDFEAEFKQRHWLS